MPATAPERATASLLEHIASLAAIVFASANDYRTASETSTTIPTEEVLVMMFFRRVACCLACRLTRFSPVLAIGVIASATVFGQNPPNADRTNTPSATGTSTASVPATPVNTASVPDVNVTVRFSDALPAIEMPPTSESRNNNSTELNTTAVTPTIAKYYDPLQGASSTDLVRRALTFNGELTAARLEATRARARLRQAGLRPNPTIDFEQTTGRLTGSRGESETSIGFALPLELGGRRRARLSLARAELEAVEAEIANRERQLVVEVRSLYAEALGALRELETTESLTNLNLQIVRVVQTRVNEGDTPPLELNLLRVEVDRLRSRRALVEGRLLSSLIRLKSLTGVPPAEVLRLGENITAPSLPAPPATLDAAIEIALRTRPDLKLARLNEEVAQAGLRLARAQSRPEVTAFTRYTQGQSSFDDTPIGILRDRDRTLTFGASIGIPLFNKGQGLKAEAATAIEQARTRREFAEAIIRSDVTAAYARYEAARVAVNAFEQGVITRSNENIRVIRAAYDLGEYRITDLLNEQRRLIDSQREFTEALSEQYRALADVQAAIGLTESINALVEPQQ